MSGLTEDRQSTLHAVAVDLSALTDRTWLPWLYREGYLSYTIAGGWKLTEKGREALPATETLAQYQALAGQATKGPWSIDIDRDIVKPHPFDAEMAEYIATAGTTPDSEFIAASRSLGPAMAAALQAVSELHYRVGHAYLHVGYECDECGTEWPCPTAAIIAKHLEGK